MFKFFPDEDESANKSANGSGDKNLIQFAPCKEIIINDSHYSLVCQLKNLKTTSTSAVSDVKVSRRVSLKCVNLTELSNIKEVARNDKVQTILKSTSDLVSGVYEGGFKTWECTFDLINYLQDNFESHIKNREGNSENTGKQPLRILDLGCGSGLAGLAILKLAEEEGLDVRVDLQDYNEEVINYITIPNSLLNFDDESVSKCSYFSGDWDSFKDVIAAKSQPRYDIILSSETIYNLDYLPKFLGVVKSCLEKRGSLYLAAKTFYFGVGGGTKVFLNMIAEDKELEATVLHVIKEGVQREIIRVQRRQTEEVNS